MKDLIDYLEELRLLLNNKKPIPELAGLLSLLNKSGVERTTTLKKVMGPGCPYYRKSKELFLSKDYDRIFLVIKELEHPVLKEVKKQFRIVEGPNER
jgi:hypothetical protein